MPTKKKKTSKSDSAKSNATAEIGNSKELKEFLMQIRDTIAEGQASMVNASSVMNYVLNLPNIYDLLDKDCKEIARDIWLRMKQAGLQLKNPPLLFDADEAAA